MNVVIQGRQHRFLSGSLGDKPITEIWLGDKQIWPNVEGLARNIVVELPEQGTRDWQYWVHAVEATKKEVSPSNYMRFNHDGLNFYIQHSFDGSEAYKLDGNVLTVELDGILIDQLGDSLEVQAKIPERQETVFSDSIYGASRTDRSNFPMLSGTAISYSQACAGRGNWSHSRIHITSTPSSEVLLNSGVDKQSRTWVKYGFSPEPAPDGDTGWTAVSSISGSGWMSNLRVIYPAFNKVFKLKILSVS